MACEQVRAAGWFVELRMTRRSFLRREPIGVTMRRTRAQMLAMIHDPAQRERYLAENPESYLPALPKPRIKRPVDGLPPKASEHDEQKAVIDWWRKAHGTYQLPELALFSVPNGSFLGSSYFSAAKLKSEGLRRGALDLILAKPNRKYHGLFIEMKAGDNTASEDQKAFIAYLNGAGYLACVHWGAESAIEEIKSYLVYDETMALIP